MKLWYISFSGGEPDRFLGGLHIWAPTFEDAVKGADASGKNPGGEALCCEVPRDVAARVPKRYISRLVSKDELAAMAAEICPETPGLFRLDSEGNILERLPHPDK